MKKKPLFIGISVFLAAGALVGAIVIQNSSVQQANNLIRECPELWYDNQMPRMYESDEARRKDNTPTQYLIFNGERKEVEDYDLNWIRENCPVNKPSPVY